MAVPVNLESYRRSAETFLTALETAYYRHYAGLEDDFEIESIYSRHRQLFERGAVESIRELRERAAPGSEERRRLGMLLDFASQGYLGQDTKAIEAELARRESSLVVKVGGESMGFREAAVVQANEPDAGRRTLIERGRLELIDRELRPLQEELIERQHAGARALGWSSYRDLCAGCKDLDLPALHAQTQEFLAATEGEYQERLERELHRTVGIGLAELTSADLPWFFRAACHDGAFPAERLVPSYVETLEGLGIDLSSQKGVTLDVEPRRKKSPRAFCAPVRVPGEVYLVIAPIGGQDDFEALFHEGGHLEHAANVDPGLPFEFRRLGDNAITETFAFLFQHLVADPVWLERRLGVPGASELAGYAVAERLVYLRRYASKLSYELELHDAGTRPASMRSRYSELLGSAIGVPWPGETFLADVDPGFYCTCYLRAWALETRLRRHLRERFGAAWFDSREAGEELRRLWRTGQRLTPDELLASLTGEELDFRTVLEELAE